MNLFAHYTKNIYLKYLMTPPERDPLIKYLQIFAKIFNYSRGTFSPLVTSSSCAFLAGDGSLALSFHFCTSADPNIE